MNILLANITTESGKSSKTVLPPRSMKEIPFKGLFHGSAILYTPLSLAKRCVFVVNVPYWDVTCVYLYNGGLETQWIEHEETIAEY